MRRLALAELILLAAAFAVGLILLLALLCRRRGPSIVKRPPPPELPLSRGESRPLPSPTKRNRRRHHLHFLLMLCSSRRRRARVEPASAISAESSPSVPQQETEAWRERWFGPASRALYTIQEEDEVESTGGDLKDVEEPELETPFYTPPASPPRLISGHSPASENAAS